MLKVRMDAIYEFIRINFYNEAISESLPNKYMGVAIGVAVPLLSFSIPYLQDISEETKKHSYYFLMAGSFLTSINAYLEQKSLFKKMQKLEDELKKQNARLSTHETRLSTHETRLSTHDVVIGDIQPEVVELKTELMDFKHKYEPHLLLQREQAALNDSYARMIQDEINNQSDSE